MLQHRVNEILFVALLLVPQPASPRGFSPLRSWLHDDLLFIFCVAKGAFLKSGFPSWWLRICFRSLSLLYYFQGKRMESSRRRLSGGSALLGSGPLSMGERYFMISIFQWIKYYIPNYFCYHFLLLPRQPKQPKGLAKAKVAHVVGY